MEDQVEFDFEAPAPTPVVFLLGPAGSGKTWQCSREVLDSLKSGGDGPPLILLAPRQATYQWERSLLSDPGLPGYSRLHVLSFQRLAEWVLEWTGAGIPKMLSEQGRVMVIRALVSRHASDLKLFQRSSRQPGFARELSLLFKEIQHCRVSPDQVMKMSEEFAEPLGSKLHDIGFLMGRYEDWIKERGIEDQAKLLEIACVALKKNQATHFLHKPIGGLWLDGFAGVTLQELELLSAILPACRKATLAFCLEREPKEDLSWLSTWAPLAQAYRSLRLRLGAVNELSLSVRVLERNPAAGRFCQAPRLAELEEKWSGSQLPTGGASKLEHEASIAIFRCSDLEAEVELAAREILRHVRDRGGRFREIAVLVRNLSDYHPFVRRIFRRAGIAFFFDRREPIGHHPLAELLRSVLKLAAGGWRRADLFSALKTGLLPVDDVELDWLENEAIARGWERDFWRRPVTLQGESLVERRAEEIRAKVVPPLAAVTDLLSRPGGIHGHEFADSVAALWEALEVERVMDGWETPGQLAGAGEPWTALFHQTVLGELESWLEDIRTGLGTERLALDDWQVVVDSGLAGLTAGVIPPSLDQVLVGSVDRARNPDLRLVILPGLNEGIFPAPPGARGLFSESDRRALDARAFSLGPGTRAAIGLEWFYGYIAFTRSRERVVGSFAEKNSQGDMLHPSPFIAHLRRLLPGLEIRSECHAGRWWEVDRLEQVLPFYRASDPAVTGAWSEVAELLRLGPPGLPAPVMVKTLSPAIARRLLGTTLKTSVSRLEAFAACPFKFFLSASLRADERREFVIDARESGSLQHEILAMWHDRARKEHGDWRNVPVSEALSWLDEIGEERLEAYGGGRFGLNSRTRFAGEALICAVKEWLAASLRWMPHYSLSPILVEKAFGMGGQDGGLPPWKIELEDGLCIEFRGKIDRVDAGPPDETGTRPVVILDYKMSGKSPNDLLLRNGIQMQLAAYLAAVQAIPELAFALDARALEPIGGFYADLKGKWPSAASRGDAKAESEEAWKTAYRHLGRFDSERITLLDGGYPDNPSGQFNYRVTKAKAFAASPRDPMGSEAFRAMLKEVRELLKGFGGRILEGEVGADPYRSGAMRACDHCDYRTACRVDPSTHPFRNLKSQMADGSQPGGDR